MKVLFLVGLIIISISSALVAQDETTPTESNGDDFSILDNLSTSDDTDSNSNTTNLENTPGPTPTVTADSGPTEVAPQNESIPNPPDTNVPAPLPTPAATPLSHQSFTIEEGGDTAERQQEEQPLQEEKLPLKEEEELPPQTANAQNKKTEKTSPTWEQERYENDLKLIEANLFNDDINLTEKNHATGLYTNKHNTSDDYLRFTMQFQFNPNVELNQFNKVAAIKALEFQCAQNVFPFWYEFFFGLSSFDLTQTTDLTFKEDQSEALISFGAGISYRFRLFQNYFNDERYFETVQVFATYNMLNLTQTSEYYTGLGYRAEFGAHKRINIHNHLGLKFAYHLAPLQEDTQRKKQMTLSWVSMGLDWSFYF